MKETRILCDVCGKVCGDRASLALKSEPYYDGVESGSKELSLDICDSCLRKYLKKALYGPYNTMNYDVRAQLILDLTPFAKWV